MGNHRGMSDPVFLITGASSGIGAAKARLASQAGYRVVEPRAPLTGCRRSPEPPHVDVNEILIRPTAQSS
jgi:hypothetical protein